MFHLVQNLVKWASARGEMNVNILLIGLDGAGKTTLAHGLKGEQPPETIVPTMGFNFHRRDDGRRRVKFTDLGGGSATRTRSSLSSTLRTTRASRTPRRALPTPRARARGSRANRCSSLQTSRTCRAPQARPRCRARSASTRPSRRRGCRTMRLSRARHYQRRAGRRGAVDSIVCLIVFSFRCCLGSISNSGGFFFLFFVFFFLYIFMLALGRG
jgi:hypothetical protein